MPDDEVTRYCYNCAFYDDHTEDCRYHAPRPRYAADVIRDDRCLLDAEGGGEERNDAMWPHVAKRDWCGRWVRTSEPPPLGWMTNMAHPSD